MFITNHSQVVMFAQVQPVAGLCFAVKGLTGVSLIKLLQMSFISEAIVFRLLNNGLTCKLPV